MEEIGTFAFLSGVGLGGVVTLLIKHFLEQNLRLKEIWLLDYKSSCDDLLNTYREVALNQTEESLKKYAYCELKLQLYASEKVLKKLQNLKESTPNTAERKQAEKALVREMRIDLGFA